MAKPKPDELVHVVVTEKPQRVFVVCQGRFHTGRWKTVNPGEVGTTPDGDSRNLLLNAALFNWNGGTHFTTSFGELDQNSNGYGAWGD